MTGEQVTDCGDVKLAHAAHGIEAIEAGEDYVAMRFGDGSWAYGASKYRYEDAEIAWDVSIPVWDSTVLVRIGVITQEEREAAMKAFTEKQNRDRMERDRRDYERLKAKYEGTTG